jgi:hypothetical protein
VATTLSRWSHAHGRRHPAQLRHVRAALRCFIGACPVIDDAVHLLSELSANAITHSDSGKPGGTFTVRARHFANCCVHGEVEDQGSNWHGNLPMSAARPHGLYLLLLLASACGVEQTGRVHVVWFRLDCPEGVSIPSTPDRRTAQ